MDGRDHRAGRSRHSDRLRSVVDRPVDWAIASGPSVMSVAVRTSPADGVGDGGGDGESVVASPVV